MKRVLKIFGNIWENASRDKRELSVCRELGMEVMVLSKGGPKDYLKEVQVDGFPDYLVSTRPLGTARWLNAPNRILSLFVWAHQARKLRPDIITGQNITGLLIGYLSNLGNRHKAKLVYDSHEFELGRAAAKRTQFQIWLIKHIERFLIRRCDFSIMVNDSIADEVQRIHRLKNRPVVVRNIPPRWELDPEEMARVRADILKKLGLPEETFLMVYHGWLFPDRGIENLLRAAAMTPGTAVLLLGNAGTPDYLASLHALCGELGVSDRVLFHPAVPINILRNYVGAANIGASLIMPTYKSYYLSLPNKFFENIQSLTPLIASDFPEMGKLVREYDIGLAVNPESPEDIAAAICRLRDDREFYAACKERLKRAKEVLCWEREKEVLKEAYRKLL